MAAKSNVVISEGQVTFKRVEGHKHDGLTSSLIDTSKYSMFDFIATENSKDATRSAKQQNNKNVLKTFIIDTIESRVLNPAGIRVQANAITAREIVSGTITADELSSNIVLVNNIIRSNNFINNTTTYTGWAIYSNGEAYFNNVNIRGNLATGIGVYSNTNTPLYADSAGNFSLKDKLTWDGTTLTIKGNVSLTGNTNLGTFDNGDPITDGYIGGIDINASELQSNSFASGSAGFRISSNGNAEFNNVVVRGNIQASSGFIGGWDLSGTDLLAGDYVANDSYGQYALLSATGEITGYRKDFNYGIGEYWVKVDINETRPGLTVRGTANEADLTSYVTSSVIYAGLYHESATNFWAGSGYGIKGRGTYTYLGGDSDSPGSGTMRVVNATALYSDASTTSTNKLVCITSTGTLQVYGGVANTYATSDHTHSVGSHNHDATYVNTDGDTMTGILTGTGIDMSGNLRFGGKCYSTDTAFTNFGSVGGVAAGAVMFRANTAFTLYDRSLTPTGTNRAVYVNSDSTLFCGANVSSLRYKNNITDAVLDTQSFLKLKIVNFYYNDELCDLENEPEKELQIGVIAENVDELGLSDLLVYDDQNRPDVLRKESLVFYLIKTCQNQQDEIDDLKARIQALEGV